MKLVIVESPSKGKKIKSFLGADYECRASMGHIAEIEKGWKGVDKETLLPTYTLLRGKKRAVQQLLSLVKEATQIYLATDPDREGEAIAYHLCLFLKLCPRTTPRIRFHEITKHAILQAFQNPLVIDMNLVRAQQARQVLDLWVGFTLSPFLWKAVGPRLSAGRCQSPALRMLVDREERLKDLSCISRHLALYADFEPFYQKCTLENCPPTWEAILDMVSHFPTNPFEAYEATSKSCRQLPAAPFITSTIQQDAHTVLGLSPLQCMSVLQSLYEKGRITYMRTDSPTLSPAWRQECEEYIVKKYGATLYESRQYDSSKTSQDAHEAIRPTKIKVESLPEGSTDLEKKMYARIWKRAVASQMAPYRYTETVTRIRNGPYRFRHLCTNTLQEGWKMLYGLEESIPQQPPTLPCPLQWKGGRVTEEYDKTQGRHSEASLVREMEKRGIGRPSTFASLGAKLLERNYATVGPVQGKTVPKKQLFLDKNFQMRESNEMVKVGEESKKYRVTPVGHQVMNYLKENFPLVLNYSMTESMENDLDDIARDGSFYYPRLSRWLSQFSWEKNK